MPGSLHIRKIAFAGAVAALYAALTISIAPLSFGPVQFRLAEALCIMPFFFPGTAAGLFIGCVFSNLLSPYGVLDIIAGSFATLLAALCTARIGRVNRKTPVIKALACFPPVIINALVIGAVIAWTETSGGSEFRIAFAVNGLQIGLGQLAVMYIIGMPLMIYLPKLNIFNKLSEQYRL